jgi:hypothetical protein
VLHNVRALASLSANTARNPTTNAERVVGPMAGRLSGRREPARAKPIYRSAWVSCWHFLALRSPQRRDALKNLDAILHHGKVEKHEIRPHRDHGIIAPVDEHTVCVQRSRR